jgi:uncharacterized protein (DUF608 family)
MTLFPTDLPEGEWVEFEAQGFAAPVVGVIHRRAYRALCGMPLGGIDTGCLDLETSGLFGLCSIFNSHTPRRGALNLPFLGLSVGGQTWVLTTGQQSPEKGTGQALDAPRPPDLVLSGVRLAKDIYYWGHYPVADMEFETDAPIGVGLRAWTPFLPGDVDRSVLPGAVFEVHVRNTSATPKSGTLAFSFFGPSYAEQWSWKSEREVLQAPVRGISVISPRSSYVLGVLGDHEVRMGGELGLDGEAWASIGERLPPTLETKSGASVGVDFDLAPGEEDIVRFVLAWHSPHWMSTGNPAIGPRAFRHMYSMRYRSALAAAQALAEEHETLLGRVLAWQQDIYAERALPGWLREVLLNMLHVYTETSFWAVAEPPIGDWCRPEDGLFSTMESPRRCPQMECLPVSFFGTIPLVYFFPQLALSTLRAEKAYQSENGAPPMIFGGEGAWTKGPEVATPTLGYEVVLSTTCYVAMVDRYGLLHGDDRFVHEFYPSVKRSIEFMIDLNRGPDGIVSMPDRLVSVWPGLPYETEWYEYGRWTGIVPHVGGLRLATLCMAERMAKAAGDAGFARQCREWILAGSTSLEEKTWLGEYYARYFDPDTGERSEDIFSAQLDGEWLARMHGFESVFRPERIATTLETIKRTCVAGTELGTLLYTCARGAAVRASKDGKMPSYRATETMMQAVVGLGLTYMYSGQVEFGLEMMRRTLRNNICEQGLSWYGLNTFDAISGKPITGTEYSIGNLLWGVLAAMEGKDLTSPAQPGGLVDRIIWAASG